MSRLRVLGLISSVVVGFVLASCSLLGFTNRTIVCDGLFPQWVLDEQDYEGGGCAEVIPLSQAPPNADWTPVWTGYAFCSDGELFIDEECVAWPADQPWPSNHPYP